MLDADLLSFIRGSIRSTWALELLLLLRRESERTHSQDELVRALRGTPLLIKTCVEQLQNAGVLACEANESCRYSPASPAVADICEKLARVYGERPLAVINAIVASPNDRLQNFADAFRFTKKDD